MNGGSERHGKEVVEGPLYQTEAGPEIHFLGQDRGQ